MSSTLIQIRYFIQQFVEMWILGPVCMGGLQNILVWLIVVMTVLGIYKSIKKKKLKVLHIIIALLLLSCCLYPMLDLRANIRLLVAFSGHPVIACTTEEEKIITVATERFYLDTEFKSGEKDKDGFEIAPLTIRTYKLLFFYYSRYIGEG